MRPETPSEYDIASHERARASAAKVRKNPRYGLLQTIKSNLDQINKDMSFGVSYSQRSRNSHAKDLCKATADLILKYANGLISTVNIGPNEVLTE